MSRVNKGRKHKEETKRKISASLKGNPNLRTWSGRKHTEEYKQHMRELRTGYKMSEETKEKLRRINTGKKYSEEHKRKMSDATKNMLWYNNGKVSIRVKLGGPIPEGFVRGRGSF